MGLFALRESTIRIALLVLRTMDPITAPLSTARIYTEISVGKEARKEIVTSPEQQRLGD
jgi:hypothetical protein